MEENREQDTSDSSRNDRNGKAREGARGQIASFAEEARSMADQQKAAGAERVARLGQAVHGAAEEIGRELPQAAQFVHSAAQGLENISSALRERSIGELAAELKTLTKRQPAAAFVGWVAAGFALSRFLKSSASPSPGDQNYTSSTHS
jgi:hypothetical protein